MDNGSLSKVAWSRDGQTLVAGGRWWVNGRLPVRRWPKAGREQSYEDQVWGNGAFTKALVEGINGAADGKKTGRVTHKMLDLYISERVKELTKGKQHPVTQAPGGVPDFPLAVIK